MTAILEYLSDTEDSNCTAAVSEKFKIQFVDESERIDLF
jgi:hypothetical protein